MCTQQSNWAKEGKASTKSKQSDKACEQAKHVEPSQKFIIVKPKQSKAKQASNQVSKLGAQLSEQARLVKKPANQLASLPTNQQTNQPTD